MPASGLAESILVVDDDLDARDAIADVLRDAGYTVDVAGDGGQALALMRTSRPRLVLLDLVMPIVDGWEVIREMGRDPSLSDIPVCVVSGQPIVRLSSSASLLRKPFSSAALIRTVQAHCSRDVAGTPAPGDAH
jgi:DNA-binding response OmpR family regulator